MYFCIISFVFYFFFTNFTFLDSSLIAIFICMPTFIKYENFILLKHYYMYNYTPLYLKIVHNWLVC